MVRIINGEIVQDNDPRLRKTSSNTNTRASGNYGRSNISSLHGGNSNGAPQTPNNPSYPQNQSRSQNPPSNPLDMVAKYFGIDQKTITIPAIEPLGFTSTTIGMIYFVVLGGLCLFIGVRALLFGVVIYVLFKISEKNSAVQN
jgi:hypothetical protein